MDSKRIFLRKMVICNEREFTEISNEKCKQTKQLELINTNIQETEMLITRMTSERNQGRKETCISQCDMNNSRQQIIENNVTPAAEINMLNSVTECDETGEAGDSCRRSGSIGDSIQFDENLSLMKNKVDNTPNYTKDNDRDSEKCKLDVLNEIEENDTVHNDKTARISDTIENFDTNLTFSGSDSGNSQISFEKSAKANKNTYWKSPGENCKSPNYKAKKIPPKSFHQSGKFEHEVGNNFIETCMHTELDKFKRDNTDKIFFPVKTKDDKVKKILLKPLDHSRELKQDVGDDLTEMELARLNGILKILFTAKSEKGEEMTKSASEVNNVLDSDIWKIPISLNDMISKNKEDDCRSIKAGMKGFLNENIRLSNREDIKNYIKKCSLSLKSSENERKRRVDKQAVSRSVTDLIIYFESLNPKKQPNEKLKKQSFESKKGKKDHIVKVDRIIKSNDTPLSLTQKPLKISSKTDVRKGAFIKQPKVILYDSNTDNRKPLTKEVPGNALFDVNIDTGKRNNEESPKESIPDSYTGVRNTSFKIISEQYPPDLNTLKSEKMLSPTAKLGNDTFCKEKCEQFEQAVNRSEDKSKNIKVHAFVIPDDAFKEMEQPAQSNPRRFRSRFTRKHSNSLYQRPFNNLDHLQYDEKPNVSFVSNNTKECGSILPDSRNETDLRISSTNDGISGSSLVQESNMVQKHEEICHSKRKKPRSTEKDCNAKCFFVIFLAVLIFAKFFMGVFEN